MKHRNPRDSSLRNLTPIQTRKLTRITSGVSTLPLSLPSYNTQPQSKRRNIPRSVPLRENILPISSRDVNIEFYVGPKEPKGVINGGLKSKNEVPIPVHQPKVLRPRNLIDNSTNLILQPTYPDVIPQPFINGNGTPSTDSNDSSLPLRLETSASVPYNLSEATTNGMSSIKHSLSTASMPTAVRKHALGTTTADSSESMPNLESMAHKNATEPVGLHRSPVLSSSLSESDITSEQSGWVSSHRSSVETSSGQISPTGEWSSLKNYEVKIHVRISYSFIDSKLALYTVSGFCLQTSPPVFLVYGHLK